MGVNVPEDSGLSVAIGANASSLQMAGAYSAFASEGIYHKPQFVSKIETPDGLTRNYDSSGVRVMKKSTAYMITDMLKGVIKSGSGTYAKIPDLYQAGKTGTVKYSDEDLAKYPSYNSTPKDSWFVGYTRSYSIGIWTGYDNLKDGTISGVGQQSAQLMYKNMMSYLMKDKPNTNWKKPDSVVRAKIIKNSNPPELASAGQSGVWQLFVKGHAPAGISDSSAGYDENDEEVDSDSKDNDTVNNNNYDQNRSSNSDNEVKVEQHPERNQNTDEKTQSSSQSSRTQSSTAASQSSRKEEEHPDDHNSDDD